MSVNVWFKDENDKPILATSNPNATNAKFYIRVQSMQKINNVTGTGVINAGEEAVIKWLIVPAAGASGGRERGTLYFVGADFNYSLDGQKDSIAVAPDTIYVKPMPLLTLDYFIPRNVVADDPFTTEVEAAEPFTLGVRVQNNGSGVAKGLKIDSAQPKIVENKQGLLINFELLSSYVADQSVANSLLMNFGDIASNKAKVGRWQMAVSLSGEFTEFGAKFSHASELGGQLTSLLKATKTHFLIRDVLVDMTGRDAIRDFLVEGLSAPSVYESDGVTSNVLDQSSVAKLTFDSNVGKFSRYKLTLPTTASLFYVRLDDPLLGVKQISHVTRSDGKNIHKQNFWLSKKQDKKTHQWRHFVNLFDGVGTDTYYFYFQDKKILPRPPVIQYIPQRLTSEGSFLGYQVEASDPDGNPVTITAAPLPAGATFIDIGQGAASFKWTPAFGQAGRYAITYSVSDGSQQSQRTATIVVNPADDIDGDGLNDQWEIQHFGNLNQDGLGDFDGDGISNLDEFEKGTNPAVPDGPPAPTIFSPVIGGESDQLLTELSVKNGIYTGPHTVVYQFELYADKTMAQLIEHYNWVPWETHGISRWTPGKPLKKNTNYFWRVRSYDGFTHSPWANGHFFVYVDNQPPTAPLLSSPLSGTDLQAIDSRLEVSNAHDPNKDKLYYNFKLYADANLTTLIADSGVVSEGTNGMTAWLLNSNISLTELQAYYWQVTVTDSHNASTSSAVFSFIWNNTNQIPPAPVIISPLTGSEVITLTPDLKLSTVVDLDGDSVNYIIQLDKVSTFDSLDKVETKFLVDNLLAEQQWLTPALKDNTRYYWRVKAVDARLAETNWLNAEFFVNTKNDPPSVPVIKNPGDTSWVSSLTPRLALSRAIDIDNDPLTYEIELYVDKLMTQLVAKTARGNPEWMLSMLSDNSWYYWRARAVDDNGLASGWTVLSSFFVNDNGFDDPPGLTWVTPIKTIMAPPNTSVALSWEDSDADSSATIKLFYSLNVDGSQRTIITQGIAEDNDGDADRFNWNIGQLKPGTYHIFAEISDAINKVIVKAAGAVVAIPEPIIPGNIIVDSVPLLVFNEDYDNTGSGAFKVVLDKAPTSEVTVPLINPQKARLNMSANQLLFTPANWNVPQTVNLMSINNCIVDQDDPFSISVDLSVSQDEAFNGLNGKDVKVQIRNDDAEVITVGQPANSITMCGTKVAYTIKFFGYQLSPIDFYFKNNLSQPVTAGPFIVTKSAMAPVMVEQLEGAIYEVKAAAAAEFSAITNDKAHVLAKIKSNSDVLWMDPAWYKITLTKIVR